MAFHTPQFTFSQGEVSPRFLGRKDINRYKTALDVCVNWLPLPQGGIQTRYGTQYVATLGDKPARLESFEFSIEQTYMTVMQEGQTFIYNTLRNGAAQISAVTTPYVESEVLDVQVTQSADVQFLVHPNHPPAVISRLDASTFFYIATEFRPQPYVERNTTFNTTAAVIGGPPPTVILATGTDFFLAADVNRQFVAGTGRALITSVDSSTQATATQLQFFDTTNYAAGAWALEGSPVADIQADADGPVGGGVTVHLQKKDESKPDLIPDGQAGWFDRSGRLLSSGTTTGGTDGTNLNDTSATFRTDGIQAGHKCVNVTNNPDSLKDVIRVLSDQGIEMGPSTGASWASGNSYEVRETGAASWIASTNGWRIHGQANGAGWVEREVTVTASRSYWVQFDVLEGPVSVLVGESSLASGIVGEARYEIGKDREVTFAVPAGVTSVWVGFRNNQNFPSVVQNIRMRESSIEGFRDPDDIGKLVAMDDGIIEIQVIPDATHAQGIIWAELTGTNEDDAPRVVVRAGRWVLGTKAWSQSEGYPRAISFHSGRLYFGGTTNQPLTIWGSVVGLFDNFTLGTRDDDAVAIEISANQMNTIEWMEPFQDLFIGTRGGEHLITGGNNPITPANKAQVPQDTEGSPPLRPVRVENLLYHVSRDRRSVHEMTLEADVGLAEKRDITLLADHITESGIIDWALQRHPEKILWLVRTDGTLLAYTFEVGEQVRGWSRHTTNGLFESVGVVPIENPTSEETEEVWVVVNRNGTRMLEVLRPDDVRPGIRKAGLTVDSAVRYDLGSPTTILTNLGHLEGQTVRIIRRDETPIVDEKGETRLVDRMVNLGEALVQGGQVVAPSEVQRADVGLAYLPFAKTLEPELDTQEGSIIGRKKRYVKTHVDVYETCGLTINGNRLSMRLPSDLLDTYIEPRTARLVGKGTEWSVKPQLEIQQDESLPATVLSIIGELEVSEAD